MNSWFKIFDFSKKSTLKEKDVDKDETIKQLKKENKRLAKEISQLKIKLLEFDSTKQELEEIYEKYEELSKEVSNKRNFESDIQNIQTLVLLSIKMRNLLIECRKERLPINLGQQIESVLKEAKELD